MKSTELAALLFVALWLQYVTKVAPFPASVNIQYEKIQKIKKPQKTTSHRRKLFPDNMKIEDIPQTDDAGIHYDHIQKRHTVSKFQWDSLQKTEVIPPINNKFFPEYGVLFQDHGYLMSGLKKSFLFVTVDIPKKRHIKEINLDLPDCADWAECNLRHWQGTQINVPEIRELIHQQVCGDIHCTFRELKTDIDEAWRNLTYQVEQQIPSFVPNPIIHTTYGDAVVLNNGEKWYSRHKPDRMKRAVPIGVILAAINVIGGLSLKGADVYNNWRRNSAMSEAMNVLIENDKRFHERMIRLEDDVGLMASATATGFKEVNEGFRNLNISVQRGLYKVDSMMNQTEQKFKQTHETLNNHHLAIHYLSKALAVVLPLMTRYRNMLVEYRMAVKGFIDGLDEMSTGRLCFEILDPIALSRFLRTITKSIEGSDYELAFPHTYQYYAEPMISFANSPDYLIIQIPIFLRYKFQPLMSLFSTDVVPVPYDAQTYLGEQNQFTEIKLRKGYFAVSSTQYVELTKEQLELCWKMRSTYYCEQAYLLISTEIKSCEAAIYFEMEADVKIASCDFRYTKNKEYLPKIMDTGDQFVLSNLPQPWILLCEKSQKPFVIPYSTYRIINHTELCECSLSAAYDYQINKAQVLCDINAQQDADFVTYFAHNQAIVDVLNSSFQVNIVNQLREGFNTLTEDIPRLNLPELQWYKPSEEELQRVYDSTAPVVDVELTRFLEDIKDSIDEWRYTDIEEWVIAQKQFTTFMKEGEWWQRMQFVTAILGTLCWIVAILLCVCYKKMIIATILSSQKLEEFEIIKSIPTHVEAAPTLPPHVEPVLTLFPPDVNADGAPMSPEQIMSTLTILIVVAACIFGFALCLWKRFRFASNVMRSCFPWFPASTYHRGIAKADIFIEITRVAGAKSTWAHFTQIKCHPTLLKWAGYLHSRDITIFKHCCSTVMQINWDNVIIQDHMGKAIRLPNLGRVSIWSSSDLFEVNSVEQYQIRILGRVLDQIYDIPVDAALQQQQVAFVEGAEYVSAPPYQP